MLHAWFLLCACSSPHPNILTQPATGCYTCAPFLAVCLKRFGMQFPLNLPPYQYALRCATQYLRMKNPMATSHCKAMSASPCAAQHCYSEWVPSTLVCPCFRRGSSTAWTDRCSKTRLLDCPTYERLFVLDTIRTQGCPQRHCSLYCPWSPRFATKCNIK